MTVSVFELFSIGIGPSSSHTVGPMKAAVRFAEALDKAGVLDRVEGVTVDLFGSLALTGIGHGTDRAVLLGLMGHRPDTVDVDVIDAEIEAIDKTRRLLLLGKHTIAFERETDLRFRKRERKDRHPNALMLTAVDGGQHELMQRTFYSVGGGFVLDEDEILRPPEAPNVDLPYPFGTAAELLAHAAREDLAISEVVFANEASLRSDETVRSDLLQIWQSMQECVHRGLTREGIIPGGLKVRRRAGELHRQLLLDGAGAALGPLEWVNLFAISVSEENASGGRVVTAPTNGAAGIVPAVLHYYWRFVPDADEDGVVRFLLVAGAIGSLFKEMASISGAEVGCQGEVGSACSMAAGALCELLGGTPQQVENAAEIAMEHNLGLTCDPIGGLVQIPCIERNAIASVKAINAAQMALRGDGTHIVSLDTVIRTMRSTGADMSDKYKETSLGGLAVNVVEC